MTYCVIRTHHVTHLRSWNMSEADLDIWERALGQNISAAAAGTSAKTIGILDVITGKCPEISPRYANCVAGVPI